MKFITILALLCLFGTCLGRPHDNEEPISTTPESIETIFRKYDQEYPFHGGSNNDDEKNIQNDSPVMEAIIERLNEIINDDRPSKFQAPSADVSDHQRRLLREQSEELAFGPSRIDRRVKENSGRGHGESLSVLDLEQNVFLNKDLLADSYYNRPVMTTTRRPSRIPVRTSTRFPTRRPTPPVRTTTTSTARPSTGDKITDLVADELLTKPEGNKLSIPVLSVATEDFEEDIHVPEKPAVVQHRPNKVTAQTDDFEDEVRRQNEKYHHEPLFRKRRDSDSSTSSSGSYDWLLGRFSSWFNFYGETEAVEEGRKMSALSKRQVPLEEIEAPAETPTVPAEPVPVPEQVKSPEVAPLVSEAVIETILDIEDPQTRNEFAKDVPAILEELEDQEAKKAVEVEVSLVELGKTEPEPLGRVVDTGAVTEVQLEVGKSLETEPQIPDIVELKVLRDQIPDDDSRSGNAPSAKIADIVAAIPSEMISVMSTSEAVRDVPEKAREIEVPQGDLVDQNDTEAFIEVDRVVPKSVQRIALTTTEAKIVPEQVAEIKPEENLRSADVVETVIPENKAAEVINEPVVLDMEMVVEDRRPQFESPTIIADVEVAKDAKDATVPQTKTPVVEQEEQNLGIVLEPEPEDDPMPKSLDLTTLAPALVTVASDLPVATEVKGPTAVEAEETILIDTNAEVAVAEKETGDSRLNSMIIEEVMEDENVEVGFNAIAATTTLPLDWLKEEITGMVKSAVDSGSDSVSSVSISTTESTSEAEQFTTPWGSSEEADSKEEDTEKSRRKEEKRRLKEEQKRLLKEAEAQRKAMEKENSSEELQPKTVDLNIEEDRKLTKEDMVNIFSSPESDIDPRRADPIPEKSQSDPSLVIGGDHAVIKKDGVAPTTTTTDNEDDDEESEESGEVPATTINPELMQKLDEVLEQEMKEVSQILDVLENAIGEAVKAESTDAEATADVVEQTVITSKNTRHLQVGFSDYLEKDTLPEVSEARLTGEIQDDYGSEGQNSRAFVLIGSGVFLITGFVLMVLAMLIKRARRYGSLDLTVQA